MYQDPFHVGFYRWDHSHVMNDIVSVADRRTRSRETRSLPWLRMPVSWLFLFVVVGHMGVCIPFSRWEHLLEKKNSYTWSFLGRGEEGLENRKGP